eukprot:497367_1
MPRLDIRIVGARGLPDVQTFGTIDPFCTVELENKRFQTSTADNTQNPQWNEVFKFNVADENSSQLQFSVWNDNACSDDFLGCYPMSISGLNRGEVEETTVLLRNCKSNAELTIRVMAVDFGDIDENEPETAYAPPRPKPQGGLPPDMAVQYQQNYQAQTQFFQQAPPQQFQAPPPPPQRPVYRPQPAAPCPPGFNAEEYISLHPDLQAAVAVIPDRVNWAITHWNQYGHNEGRAYSRSMPPYDFNHEQYIHRYPDLEAAAAGSFDRRRWATEHWLISGVPEGRRYRGEFVFDGVHLPPGFHGEEYISIYPDLQAAVGGAPDREAWAVRHYLDFGHTEARVYSRVTLPYDFNGEVYMAKYPDLAAAVGATPDRNGWAATHFLGNGINEGRQYR